MAIEEEPDAHWPAAVAAAQAQALAQAQLDEDDLALLPVFEALEAAQEARWKHALELQAQDEAEAFAARQPTEGERSPSVESVPDDDDDDGAAELQAEDAAEAFAAAPATEGARSPSVQSVPDDDAAELQVADEAEAFAALPATPEHELAAFAAPHATPEALLAASSPEPDHDDDDDPWAGYVADEAEEARLFPRAWAPGVPLPPTPEALVDTRPSPKRRRGGA